MRCGETASNGTRNEAPRADTVTEVVCALFPRRIPAMSKSAPRAIGPPGSTEGVRLAALTTLPVRMAGGCAQSAAAARKKIARAHSYLMVTWPVFATWLSTVT